MNRKTTLTTKKIVLVALLAALTAACSALRITIPLDLTGAGSTSFHLGNVLCALSGILLGPWLGGLAAGLGSAIFDMFYPLYISEAWITFLMKGAYGLMAGIVAHAGKKEWGYWKSALAAASGAVTYALLYLAKSCFYSCMFLQGLPLDAALLATATKLPATIFNAAVAVIFAPVLATAIRTALKKNHLSIE